MKKLVKKKLKTVIDPELGINIVDLGLIYGIETDEKKNVQIRFTLTTPLCPLGSIIEQRVRGALKDVNGIKNIKTELVWDPPWRPGMMSEAAKIQLGFREASK